MENLVEMMTFELNLKYSQNNTQEMERKHLWKRRELCQIIICLRKMAFIYKGKYLKRKVSINLKEVILKSSNCFKGEKALIDSEREKMARQAFQHVQGLIDCIVFFKETAFGFVDLFKIFLRVIIASHFYDHLFISIF